LNNVWFGDCKVVVKVASFDRFGNKKPIVTTRVEGEKIIEGEKRKMGDGKLNDGGNNNVDVAQVGAKSVGNVVGGKPVLEEVAVHKEGEVVVVVAQAGRKVSSNEVQSKQVYVPKHNSSVNDLNWASKGLVVSVLNGEAIAVLQRRIFGAGFQKLVIILMGANKVFLRLLDDGDVCSFSSEVAEFFNNFFSKPVLWNKDTLIRERGAWVRIYGVPLHAWNI